MTYLKNAWLYVIAGTFMYFGYSLGVAVAFMAMHPGEPFFMQNGFVAALTGVPLVAFIIARRFKRVSIKEETRMMVAPKFFKNPRTEFIVMSIFCTLSLFVTSAFVQQLKFAVDPTEAWMFYVNIGIGEEMYWRVLLVSGITFGFASRDKKCYALAGLIIFMAVVEAISIDLGIRIVVIVITAMIFIIMTKIGVERQSFLANMIAIVVSGITFSLAHLGVYADRPDMLLVCGISGAIMAGFFAFTKNPFYNITAHMFFNGYSSYFMLFG